jgi:hypothetical protein
LKNFNCTLQESCNKKCQTGSNGAAQVNWQLKTLIRREQMSEKNFLTKTLTETGAHQAQLPEMERGIWEGLPLYWLEGLKYGLKVVEAATEAAAGQGKVDPRWPAGTTAADAA